MSISNPAFAKQRDLPVSGSSLKTMLDRHDAAQSEPDCGDGLRSHTNRARVLGFTLAEILVALALIALLGAALLPVVAGQILKGDASRVVEDLGAVRLGVEQFLADVRRYPGKYSDLSKVITTANTDINAVTYTAGLVSKWAGPYVAKDTVSAGVATGYGASINNTFMKVLNTNGIDYLTVVVTGIAGADFDRIDLQFDGVVNRTGGLLRWVSAGGIDSTKFLATAIQ